MSSRSPHGQSDADEGLGGDVVQSLDPEYALPVEWYTRPVQQVARDLLGCVIVSTLGDVMVAGQIIETEAYDGEDDPASHSAFRRNGVVQAMWGPRGTLYVYRAYGMYPCFNVVAGPERRPSAVLVRAISPLHNGGEMARRSGRKPGEKVASGPGLTGRALGIDLSHNGTALQREPLWIQPGPRNFEVVSGPRVGITRGMSHNWRFAIAGHPAISRPFRTR